MVRVRLIVAAAASVVALAGFTGAAAARPGHGSSHPGFGSSDAGAAGTRSAATATDGSIRTVGGAGASAAADSGKCTDAPVGPFATGLPIFPCVPNPFSHQTLYTDYGTVAGPTTQKVLKPKITLQVPDVTLRAFNVVCSTQFPPVFPKCPFPFVHPEYDPSVTSGYYGTFASAWVRSPKGTTPQYGVFPTLTVTMLAFGSIPVTAKVHIVQPLKHGVAQPLSLAWSATVTPVPAGKMIPGHPEDGRAPYIPSGAFWSPAAHLAGPIVIRISDVRVDQVPLPVGSACQTSTTLSLGAPSGFYSSTIPPQRGKPGAWQPLSPTYQSYLTGSVDIPAFQGCHNGAEDLDPLLTGMVSGPNNPINSTQQFGLKTYGCIFRPNDPNCGSEHPALQGSATAALTSGQRRAIRSVAGLGSAALAGLPANVRALVRSGQVAAG